MNRFPYPPDEPDYEDLFFDDGTPKDTEYNPDWEYCPDYNEPDWALINRTE